VLGFSERSGGSLYIAQAIINDHGETVATQAASSSLRTPSGRSMARGTGRTWPSTIPLWAVSGRYAVPSTFSHLANMPCSHSMNRCTLLLGPASRFTVVWPISSAPRSTPRRARSMRSKGNAMSSPPARPSLLR
jgi:hypothetical protein